MEERATIKSVGIKWGLILGILSIAFFMVGIALGDPNMTALRWVSILVIIGVIVMAHREYKNNGDGFMTYGQGLGLGTLVAAVSSVISSIFSYVYIKFIDDNFLTNAREMQIQEFERQGMTDEQIEMAVEVSSRFTTPEMILVIGIVFGIFIGFLISLIVSAFTKNSNPELSV